VLALGAELVAAQVRKSSHTVTIVSTAVLHPPDTSRRAAAPVLAVTQAKTPQTRRRRIDNVIAEVSAAVRP
jgi:hypothetical protein